jgi:hypothetical protein
MLHLFSSFVNTHTYDIDGCRQRYCRTETTITRFHRLARMCVADTPSARRRNPALNDVSAARDIGFIWLGIAVLVWPFVDPLRFLVAYVGSCPFATTGQFAAFVSFSQRIVALALLLGAVRYLGRDCARAGWATRSVRR